jgi:hypothetical protein
MLGWGGGGVREGQIVGNTQQYLAEACCQLIRICLWKRPSSAPRNHCGVGPITFSRRWRGIKYCGWTRSFPSDKRRGEVHIAADQRHSCTSMFTKYADESTMQMEE